jgi:hypothetical protein
LSEEFQWRQLGSVVNTVLLQAKTQAIRNGSFSKTAPQAKPEARSAFSPAEKVPSSRGHTKRAIGFLDDTAPAAPQAPIQLELPFASGLSLAKKPNARRSPRNLMM